MNTENITAMLEVFLNQEEVFMVDFTSTFLFTTTMITQKDTIEALKAVSLRDKVKVMVGGAPVTQSFADEIGADAYASDAASAADVCRAFYK